MCKGRRLGITRFLFSRDVGFFWVVLSMHYYHFILLWWTYCFRCILSRSTKHHWTLDTPCHSEERRAQSSYKLHLNAFKVKKAPFSFWKQYFGGTSEISLQWYRHRGERKGWYLIRRKDIYTICFSSGWAQDKKNRKTRKEMLRAI